MIDVPFFRMISLAQLLFVFETMANATDRRRSPKIRNVPEIEGYASIQKEIISLQKALQIHEEVQICLKESLILMF